jgi:anti-anti-sigma factor
LQPSLSEIRVAVAAPGVTVFELVGEYDLANAEQLEAALSKTLEGQGGIALDLSATTFIDSSIIHVFLLAQRALVGQGKQLAICSKTANIALRALEVAVPGFIPITSEREQAIAIAKGAAEATATTDDA